MNMDPRKFSKKNMNKQLFLFFINFGCCPIREKRKDFICFIKYEIVTEINPNIGKTTVTNFPLATEKTVSVLFTKGIPILSPR